MSATLLFVRHGESVFNTEFRFAGQLDSPLTARGRRQAEDVADYLASCPIHAVYASDLSRAYDTGAAIAARHALPVYKDARLREINAGVWQGMDRTSLDKRADFRLWHTDFGKTACEDGETVSLLLSRMLACTWEIAMCHDGETVCIATHTTPIYVLRSAWRGVPLSDVHAPPLVPNASVTEVVYRKDGTYTVRRDGEAAFLGADASADGAFAY